MYELVQVSEHSYYMDCPSKVGVIQVNDKDVLLIDSGSDKDAAKKLKRQLDERGWNVKAIFNTHSHADHIGGNQYFQSQTGCPIYGCGAESALTNYPFLEPTILYGGFPFYEMNNKFLLAKESSSQDLFKVNLENGLEMIRLPGHCMDMVGYRTNEDIVFLADSLSSIETLEKYKISYIYDVKTYLETLENIKNMKAKLFVPSHAAPTEDIESLAQYNINHTMKIASFVMELLKTPMTFETLLSTIFTKLELFLNLQQHLLIGSTIKSYLSYLKEMGKISYRFENNYMIWFAV